MCVRERGGGAPPIKSVTVVVFCIFVPNIGIGHSQLKSVDASRVAHEERESPAPPSDEAQARRLRTAAGRLRTAGDGRASR